MSLSLHPSYSSVTSVVYLHNGKPLFDRVVLESDTALENLKLRVRFSPDYVEEQIYSIPELPAKTKLCVTSMKPRYDLERLKSIAEAEPGQMRFVLLRGDEQLLEQAHPFSWLPANAWATGEGVSHPELIAALVQPNDPVVDKVLYFAGELLRKQGKSPSWTGYKESGNAILNKLKAIWATLAGYSITYALPPQSEIDPQKGLLQKVRTPSQIISGGCATCLDSTLLLAAVAAQAGYHPIVVTIRGHAFPCIMLRDENLKSAVVDSVSHLRNLAELGDLLPLESTLLTKREEGMMDFERAVEAGKAVLMGCDNFELAYDITQIWAHGITPLSTEKQQDATSVIMQREADGSGLTFLPEQTAAELEEEQSLVSTRKRSRMENWQLKLLDLSMRNNLLNCKPDSSQQELVIPNVATLEDQLSNGKSFRLHSLQINYALEEAAKREDMREFGTLVQQQAEEMFQKGGLLAFCPAKPIVGEKLDKRIHTLYLTARRNLEESGYNTLYIACGFLKWVRRDKGMQTLRAPLLLIPVRLTRKSVKEGFRLQTTDEEPRINLTLLELLKTEYNLRIPELENELPTDASGLDTAAIFQTVRRAIKDFDGWEVLEEISLGIFSFAKYLMWKDLCDRQHELQNNPIVKHLATEQRSAFPAQVGFPEPATLDNEADAQRVFTPLSSDSSQLSAILAAGRGKNFVLIGPPGTGKSQTISNMIAHCLGHGKTVLFVAEKAAALTVVYNRLKRIGLGDFCLELHSNKSVKKEVLAQFKAALDSAEQADANTHWEQAVSNLLQVRYGLNLLPWELHRSYPDGTTLYDDICLLLQNSDVPEFRPTEDDLLTLTSERKEEILSLTHALALNHKAIASLFPGVAEGLHTRQYSSVWEEQLATALANYATCSNGWKKNLNRLCGELGEDAAELRPHADSLLSLLQLAADTYGQDNTPLLPATAKDALAGLETALKHAETYRSCKAALTLPYPDGLEDDSEIPNLYKEWKMGQLSNFISRFFTNRRIRKTLQMHAFSRKKPDIRRDLENLLAMQQAKNAAELRDTTLPQYRKGVHMQAADMEKARQVASTLAQLRGVQGLSSRYLTPGSNPMQPGTECTHLLRGMQEISARKAALQQELEQLLGAPLPTVADNHEGAGAWWAGEMLDIRPQWRLLTIWNECADKARHNGLSSIVRQLADRNMAAEDIEDAVRHNLSLYRLRHAVDASKTLTQFNAGTHEAHIDDFRTADTKLLQTTGQHLRQLLRQRARNVQEHGREMAELRHELGKQRAHKAIRKLLSLTPQVSRLLKPCMLMSPLSVAQYLTPDAEPFDVVIFDEASQIPVWDAIGAIGRGKSAIIVGDPRQMPPTSFFSRGKTNDTEEEEEVEVDLESILDECLACGIPQMNLTWHYRSKSESLIAFSNNNYYENKLVTFPAPVAKDTALQYHPVQGTYERGGSKRYNKKEAKALVEHVLAALRSGAEYNEMTSIGIVTFNTQQQALIEDMLEKARAADETLEPYFAEDNPEAVFVKNLENVQGDERGIIYFSTTYGPDEKGNISMNFGPLNQTGGERRLNVAVTRARTGMHVFSSLKPEDIDLNRTKARGAKDLRGFLECARMGAAAYFQTAGGSAGMHPEDTLQRSICNTLQARGWNCLSNLGVSGFRVDIAVADPHHPGNMLAGIVLDGSGYASAATARDRDVLRESVLQALGWNLCHIWALDWWRNPQAYADRIDERLKALVAAAH